MAVRVATIVAVLASAVATIGGAFAASADEPHFDYLYIESNEGGSSGGHTAIRFDRHVYHFQAEDGLLVLRRERADDFLYDYTLLGNRTVHVARVAVSADTRARLVDRFRRRHRAQEAQLETQAALLRNRSMLESLRSALADPSGEDASIPFAIPGLAYFDRSTDPAGAPVGPSTALVGLRETMLRRLGAGALAERRRGIRVAMRRLALAPPASPAVPAPDSVYERPPFVRANADRWTDLAAGLAALDVLEAGSPLEPSAIRAPDDPLFALDDAEVARLRQLSDRLVARLTNLVASPRSDWGQTLLVGMARLASLERSITTRHLVFLDALPTDARTVGPIGGGRADDVGAEMLRETARRHAEARAYLGTSGDDRELAWERVEETANRHDELARGLGADEAIRVAHGHLVPARAAPYPVPLRLFRASPPTESTLQRARRDARHYANAVRHLHHYHLIDQNCATAIFETINDSLDDSRALAEARLGGYVSSRGSLAFVPFVSARAVEARYRVVARETIPSYRERRLAEMKQDESVIRVALRESNPFTAKTYVGNPADSFFVFFTDETPLLRPILGAVNLTAALGQTTLGVLRAPFDRGTWLVGGLRGTFVSLVELAFANIRKGSNEWIPEAHRTLAPVPEPVAEGR